MKTRILFLMLFTFAIGFSNNSKEIIDNNKSEMIDLNNNKFINFTQYYPLPIIMVTVKVDCDGDGVWDYIETIAEEYADAMIEQMIASC